MSDPITTTRPHAPGCSNGRIPFRADPSRPGVVEHTYCWCAYEAPPPPAPAPSETETDGNGDRPLADSD